MQPTKCTCLQNNCPSPPSLQAPSTRHSQHSVPKTNLRWQLSIAEEVGEGEATGEAIEVEEVAAPLLRPDPVVALMARVEAISLKIITVVKNTAQFRKVKPTKCVTVTTDMGRTLGSA